MKNSGLLDLKALRDFGMRMGCAVCDEAVHRHGGRRIAAMRVAGQVFVARVFVAQVFVAKAFASHAYGECVGLDSSSPWTALGIATLCMQTEF
jgi:hypothetical protein